jgi:hypothetical protein
MLRLARLLILLLVLPAAACQGPALWMAGIDPNRYDWVPLVGSKHEKAAADDLRECEAPSDPATPAKPDEAKDQVTIARAESSPMVEACMSERGYSKVYQQRITMF